MPVSYDRTKCRTYAWTRKGPLFNWVKLSFAQLSVATSFRRDDVPLQTLCARFKLFHLRGERPRAVKWKCDDEIRRGLPWCKNLWYLIARTEVWWLNNWLSCVRRVMDARGRLLRTRERKSRTRRQYLALIDRLARLLTPKSHYPRKNCFFPTWTKPSLVPKPDGPSRDIFTFVDTL